MAWEVEFTDQFGAWHDDLDEDAQEAIRGAVELLADRGPGLGRVMVDTIRGFRHPNMKELRPRGGHLRILFAFDPRRTAILLIGGDKTHRWQAWYEATISIADDLYDEHLRTLRREGLLP